MRFVHREKHDLHVLDVMQSGLHLFLQHFVFLSLGREVVCKDHWLKGSNTRQATRERNTLRFGG